MRMIPECVTGMHQIQRKGSEWERAHDKKGLQSNRLFAKEIDVRTVNKAVLV